MPINSKVTLKGRKLDQYKRTLAEVINKDGINTNLKMMEDGYAALYPYQSGCKNYKSIEKKAKSNRKGIWSDNDFVLPWVYRKNNV